jgi:hypothetical protein
MMESMTGKYHRKGIMGRISWKRYYGKGIYEKGIYGKRLDGKSGTVKGVMGRWHICMGKRKGKYKLLISDSVLYARLGSLIVPEWFREEEFTRERSHTRAWWSSPPLTRTCLDEGAH